jgi:site-specific DNA-methyltransferase (adenine-specific)
MIVQDKAISDIKPYQKNPRHKYDINKVAQSIKEFGFQQPIVVDRAGVIIVGHGRYEAAKSLNLKSIPVTIADLPPEKAKAYRIADNKTNEYSDWDMGLLIQEFTDLLDINYDLELTGFDANELEKLIVGEKEGLTDEDAVPETPEEPKAQLGDIYKLGEHRLMCGDSTNEENILKLLDGIKPNAIFTDPPYGIGLDKENQKLGKSQSYGAVLNDKDNQVAKDTFIISKKMNIPELYFWGANHYSSILPDSSCWIVWDKQGGKSVTYADCELCFTNINKPVRMFTHIWDGFRRDSERNDKRLHPTQKPVKLFTDIWKKFNTGQVILDLFLGSGSTLIACQNSDRICYGMELDPKYIDVIIKRWEQYTGQKAEKIN